MRKRKNYLFPFSVVKSAIRGDSDTLQKIWKDYEPYINTLCARPYQDAYGNQKYMIDQDMKDFMRGQLYWAITHNFDMDYNLNDT
jgi:hypothetical protein